MVEWAFLVTIIYMVTTMVMTMVITTVTNLFSTMVISIGLVIFIEHTDVADFIIVNYGTNFMVG